MPLPADLYTILFWRDATSRAVSSGSASAVTAWTLGVTDAIPSVPGLAVLAAFGCGAGIDLLRSLASLRVPNGTASFIRQIVAAPGARR